MLLRRWRLPMVAVPPPLATLATRLPQLSLLLRRQRFRSLRRRQRGQVPPRRVTQGSKVI